VVNLAFLYLEIVSTLDSLLFCIFIIAQVSGICKMGCSIRKKGEDWIKCEWK